VAWESRPRRSCASPAAFPAKQQPAAAELAIGTA
jgi:hypothetical protein